MKRIVAFFLAVLIFIISVASYGPVGVYAAEEDRTVIPRNASEQSSLSYEEAYSYVSARKDIYSKDGKLLFKYTPSSSYNWTFSHTHFSDSQVINFFMSDNVIESGLTIIGAMISNNNLTRAVCALAGCVVGKDSDIGTKVVDILTGNYNYLNALDYNEETQTITVNNDSGSVDKLRQEIYQMYCDSIGLYNSPLRNESPTKVVEHNSSLYEYDEDYMFDFNEVAGYDYAYEVRKYDSGFSYKGAVVWNRSDYDYVYQSNVSGEGICFTDKDLNVIDDPFKHYYEEFNERYNDGYFGEIESLYIVTTESANKYHNGLRCDLYFRNSLGELRPSNLYGGYIVNVGDYDSFTYSKKYKSFPVFRSYEALYNYVHGSQTAYLTSQINEIGQDISLSIKDMDENIGSKLDTLIDSINNNKGGMSAEELQDVIDKGVEDILNNTEDIKDNTEDIVNNTGSILNTLKEQNKILLDILGVTEYIAYSSTKDDGTEYTTKDLTDALNQIYNGLGNAILYGKNTLTSSGGSSAASAQSMSVQLQSASMSDFTDSSGAGSDSSFVAGYSPPASAATYDLNNMDIHNGLFGKFPFSVPYQLYEWLQVLQAEPEAPVFNYNYGFLIGKKNDPDYNLKIDLSIFEPWANVCKSFLRLSFTLLMAVGIYHHFSKKGGGGMS